MGMRRPAGVTPGKPPPRPLLRQGRGASMGQGRRKGGKREPGGKIRVAKPRECRATTGAARPPEWPMSPPEWGVRRGGARPPEWWKIHGGPATEWAGESSCHKTPTPPEWQSYPRGMKPSEGPQRARADQGRIYGGREGTKTLPLTEQPGHREPMAATTDRWAGQGQRSHRAHSGAQRQTTAARRTPQGIPLAPTAPGPSTARLRAASMAYWRQRGQQSTQTTRGTRVTPVTPVARPAMGPQQTRTGNKKGGGGRKPAARAPCARQQRSRGQGKGTPQTVVRA